MIPKISIIIPMKNEASFIEECLQSSLRQMHNRFQLEIIVVDDHSSDESPLIVQKLCERHQDTFMLIPNKGHGIIDALCTGLAASSGHYITRMDADDIMPEFKLLRLLEALIKSPESDIATGKVTYISSGKALSEGFVNYADWLNRINLAHNPFDEIYKECPIASPNWMMRMSKFKQLGGFASLVYPEDYDLVFKWYDHKLKTTCVEHITHIWRDHETRASRNDPNYADNRFVHLKVDRFLQIDRNPEKPLFVLGAGRKGKSVAKELIHRGVAFRWLTNNAKKLHVEIYDVRLENWNILDECPDGQLISAVSSPIDVVEVKSKIDANMNLQCFSFF